MDIIVSFFAFNVYSDPHMLDVICRLPKQLKHPLCVVSQLILKR